MRYPFRFAVPNWFGEPDSGLVGQRAVPRPLWRRAARRMRSSWVCHRALVQPQPKSV